VERTKVGLARARAAGVRLGRPRRVGTVDRRRAIALSDGGRSVRQVAMALKVPRSTVHDVLADARPKKVGRTRPEIVAVDESDGVSEKGPFFFLCSPCERGSILCRRVQESG
jgi:hypothetical protein